MSKLPLYHQTARDGHGGIPGWWFGAPAIAFVYAFLTPRFLPDVVSVPAGVEGAAPVLRWCVGLLFGVALLAAWRMPQWARR